jgi:hypothetical protein
MKDEEQKIEHYCEAIQGMRQRLAVLQHGPDFSEWGFVSDNEIRGIRELKDKILLRLNAPKGSILHVPNNSFELFLSVPPDLKVVCVVGLQHLLEVADFNNFSEYRLEVTFFFAA